MSLPAVPVSTLIKLASLAVHVQEYCDAGQHPVDLAAARTVANDPEVQAWLDVIDPALLPVKR